MRSLVLSRSGAAFLLLTCATSAWCQQTETPYEQSLKQQRLYDQQQQNARQQQQSQQQQQDQQYQQSLQQSQAQQNAAAAQGREVLATWQKRPPLAPEHNPLLGRWNSLGNSVPKNAAAGDMNALAAALLGGVTGGMCDSMLGRGLIEFRPGTLVAIGAGGREQVKYRVEYRGGGSRVAVLPKDAVSFTHMIIDFDGPDRARVAAVGCALARAGSAAAAEVATAPPAKALPSNAPAARRWERLASSATNVPLDFYVDRSTIQRSGHMARMSGLYDFKTAQAYEGKRFFSVLNQYEYDCALTRRRLISMRGYSQHMGQGSEVAASDAAVKWEEIALDDAAMGHWKVACGKA